MKVEALIKGRGKGKKGNGKGHEKEKSSKSEGKHATDIQSDKVSLLQGHSTHCKTVQEEDQR